jgi:hypothetical protein
VDSEGRIIFVADEHRDDGKRFVVRADKKLTASRSRIDPERTVVNTLLTKNYNIEAAPHH